MNLRLSDLWSLRGTVDRGAYAFWGVALAVVKYNVDRVIVGFTRLEGTTWYTNRMWPASYWTLWSDEVIHRIHLRVLEHIRERAEARG